MVTAVASQYMGLRHERTSAEEKKNRRDKTKRDKTKRDKTKRDKIERVKGNIQSLSMTGMLRGY